MLVFYPFIAVWYLFQAEQQKNAERNIKGAKKQRSLHMHLLWWPWYPQSLLLGSEWKLQLGQKEPMAVQDLQADHRSRRKRGHIQIRGQVKKQRLLPLRLYIGQRWGQFLGPCGRPIQIISRHDQQHKHSKVIMCLYGYESGFINIKYI